MSVVDVARTLAGHRSDHLPDPPFDGARALAVFVSGRDDLFEVVQVPRPVEGQAVIEHTPYVEPLVRVGAARRWCVALASRRDARILTGTRDGLEERKRIKDRVHGKHDQGGWSQPNYERHIEHEADQHLRHVAEMVFRLWQEGGYDFLALGGPQEDVSRLESFLHNELRSRLSEGRVEVDIGTANEDQICAALADLEAEEQRRREREALDTLAARLAKGGRASAGPEQMAEALTERRVETLLLEQGFDRPGGRCPTCGLLSLERHGPCPADGTELEEVQSLREGIVETALGQDAEVIVVQTYPDLGPHRGVAALLRF
jgi:peptide chain release factor subunit 1